MEKNLQELLSNIENEILFHSPSSLEKEGFVMSDAQSRRYGVFESISSRVPNAPSKIFREKGVLEVGEKYLFRARDSDGRLDSEYEAVLKGFYHLNKNPSSDNSPRSFEHDPTEKLFIASFSRPEVIISYTREVLDDKLDIIIEKGEGAFPQTPLNLIDRDPASRFFTLDPSVELFPFDPSLKSFAACNYSEKFGVGYDTHIPLSDGDEKRLFWKDMRKKGSYVLAASVLALSSCVAYDMAKQRGVDPFERVSQYFLEDNN